MFNTKSNEIETMSSQESTVDQGLMNPETGLPDTTSQNQVCLC